MPGPGPQPRWVLKKVKPLRQGVSKGRWEAKEGIREVLAWHSFLPMPRVKRKRRRRVRHATGSRDSCKLWRKMRAGRRREEWGAARPLLSRTTEGPKGFYPLPVLLSCSRGILSTFSCPFLVNELHTKVLMSWCDSDHLRRAAGSEATLGFCPLRCFSFPARSQITFHLQAEREF